MEIENGVGVFDDVLPKELCLEAIRYVEEAERRGIGIDRHVLQGHQEHLINDFSVIPTMNLFELPARLTMLVHKAFYEAFWEKAYAPYAQKYSVLNDAEKHNIYEIKIQRTRPQQGYHVWHHEDGARAYGNRILAFIQYLNTVEEGGETEFLYYPKRVKAVEGRCVIMPTGFYHAHRGNPPLSGDKYVLTGWVEL